MGSATTTRQESSNSAQSPSTTTHRDEEDRRSFSPDEQDEADSSSGGAASPHSADEPGGSRRSRLGEESSGEGLLSSADSPLTEQSMMEDNDGGAEEGKRTPAEQQDGNGLDPLGHEYDDDDDKVHAKTRDDDDGADHAEDVPKIPWKPQNVQSTCEFMHTITGYAQQRDSGCKKAEYSSITVDEFGNRWRLIVYVNGNGRASNNHLSLFLQVADADDLPFGWKKSVSYVLTLEHPDGGGTLSYAKRNPDKTFKLCPKAIDWGWSQFITSDRIQQEGFVSNDSLTVRASVTVKSSSVTIDAEDAELYLKCAVEDGDADAVKLCLEQGASVNCKFKDDLYTPLHTACSSGSTDGSIEVLNLLLKEGANANACNKWSETPLLIAANNGHYAACEALLRHGADPSLCSEAGWSALTFAAHKGYDDIVRLLLDKDAPVNTRVTEDNSTPLHKACAGSKPGHLASVKYLLEADADVHALNKWRETPLLTAANHGQAGAVGVLLANGADPCKCTDTGWSPLSIAAYKGHDDVVRLLLEEGAPTEEDDPTLSALLQAATKGLPDTVELLLKNGADHTVTTKKGDTALSILVEQNLIDAAVEMVTEYNASIPRCSRDRKKVQRARLLINLRMKQMKREGPNSANTAVSTDDDETDVESEGSNSAQNVENGTPALGKSKKKKNKGKGTTTAMTAEERARAAEQDLLEELAQEDAKAKKEAAEANSKRAKKRKKKERERQQKQKEEQEKREREEREARERERILKEKEEQQRREQEAKLKEQRERELKELMEREKVLEAKRKERERRERELAKQRQAETSRRSAPEKTQAGERKKKNATVSSTPVTDMGNGRNNGSNARPSAKNSAPLAGNRRWETKPKTPPRPAALAPVETSSLDPSVTSTQTAPPVTSQAVQSPVVSFSQERNRSFDENSRAETEPAHAPVSNGVPSPLNSSGIEHPAVALFRREKVSEMVRRCSLALDFQQDTIKSVLYRWVVRAAHSESMYLDPLIPSWNDVDALVAHFQRQFISESRRRNPNISALGIESLKESGSATALICLNLAKEVADCRRRVEAMPSNWSDSTLGMTSMESIQSDGTRVVSVSCANQTNVVIPLSSFTSLRGRYFGPPERFLSAVFVAKIWYESKQLIVSDTDMDVRLPSATQSCLAEASVSAELWSDPFSAYGSNVFWGTFEQVDRIFGGQSPFGKLEHGSENVLAQHGSSLSVLPPLDNMIACRYIQRMLSILENADRTNAPVSFVLFLHAGCFHDLSRSPTLNDLRLLDPRLAEPRYVQHIEVLQGGNHFYASDSTPGGLRVCGTDSLLILLQNQSGKARYGVSPAVIAKIVSSMRPTPSPRNDNAMQMPMPFGLQELNIPPTTATPQRGYFNGLSQMSPDPQGVGRSDFASVGGSSIVNPFSPSNDNVSRGSRHGRLFDLVDDGEDDQANNVDLVSGMLNNLDVGLFGNANIGSEVDIEAISLMGIGGTPSRPIAGPPSQPFRPGNPRPGRFG